MGEDETKPRVLIGLIHSLKRKLVAHYIYIIEILNSFFLKKLQNRK